MKYVVDGVEYDDYIEALNKERASSNYLKDEKDFLRHNMQVFEIRREGYPIHTLAILVDKDHLKYAKALAQDLFGVQYEIISDKLKENYKVLACTSAVRLEELIAEIFSLRESDNITLFSNIRYNNAESRKDMMIPIPLLNMLGILLQ